MGLHLNFELRLPAHTTPQFVADTLGALHRFALTQPFADVSPLLTAAAVDEATAPRRKALQFYANVVAKPYDEDLPPLSGNANSTIGFLVNPGKGCETATFALLQRHHPSGAPADWFWHCTCKTQYASIVSDTHFIACHTSLTNVLDHALSLGLDVVVRDEGHYWETRDTARLLREVACMNQLVARFAGAFSDAVTKHDQAHDVQMHAPIFHHPRFEHLEMGDQE